MSYPITSLTNLGLTEVELLAIKTSAKSQLISGSLGKTVSSVSAPGISTNFQIYATPLEIIRAADYALKILNPTTYGNANPTSTVGFNI